MTTVDFATGLSRTDDVIDAGVDLRKPRRRYPSRDLVVGRHQCPEMCTDAKAAHALEIAEIAALHALYEGAEIMASST
jgi:hypothetical protein